jgi:hypothetical protein
MFRGIEADPMNRIPETLFCMVGMAGFVWFMHWLIFDHSQDFARGVIAGMGVLVVLHLAYYLLCKWSGQRWDIMS